MEEKLNAIETAIQLLTAQIINLRTELLVIKAQVNTIAENTSVAKQASEDQEYQDTQNYMEHIYEGGE